MTPNRFDTLPPLREVIANGELVAKKSLGQHFLCDLNLTKKLVSLAGNLEGQTVIEVGPGPGGLTRALLMSPAKKIIAVEKDQRFLPALRTLETLAEGRFEVLEGDALQMNCATLAKGPKSIVSNLPYNIATELLLGWLHNINDYQSLTLMFQSEVVDRLTAKPHSKSYGRLSVITQFCCDAKRVMDIPARAFTPPPKVDSAVIHLTPRTTRPTDVALKKLETVTKAAFGQRRKMLRSSLKSLGGEALLQKASLNPMLRAEDLSLSDFESLVRLMP